MTEIMELTDHYKEFFYVTRADTEELRNIAFKLRYEVYVKDCEYKFYNPYAVNEIEKDSYDEQSHHCLLYHKPSNQPIGYIRLIPFIKKNGKPLPIEQFGVNFHENKIQSLRTSRAGEISRMSILPTFRRRLCDRLYLFEDYREAAGQRFRINYIPMCLVLACGVFMKDLGIDYSVALIEKRLVMLLKKYGVIYQQIGDSVELNGIRTPYMLFRQETYENLIPDFKQLYEIIESEILTGVQTSTDVKETQTQS